MCVNAPGDEAVIRLPSRATVEESFQVLAACEQIEASPVARELDSSETTMFGPLGVALLALALERRRSAQLPDLQFRVPAAEEARHFLDEVGFSRFLSSEQAEAAQPSGTLQMRRLRCLMPIYTEQIAQMIGSRVPGTPDDVAYLIQLCLNELLQNAFEHADSKEGSFVLARWYSRTRSVRIAVVDGGVGIPAALRRKEIAGLQRKGDWEVIVDAVTRQGITSREGTKRGGFGLKLLREAAIGRGGKVVVISSTAKAVFKPSGIQRPRSRLFRGTAVEMDFRPLAPFQTSGAEGVF